MALAPFDTQKYFPWNLPVTVTSSRKTGDVAAANVPAGCYPQQVGEAGPSRGVATANRCTFTFASDVTGFDPKPFDRVTWRGTDYTVQTAAEGVFLKFWTVTTIALVMANDLADTAKLVLAGTAAAGGFRHTTFTDVAGATSMLCRVQPLSGNAATAMDELVMPGRYRAYLDRQVYPAAGDLLVVADGTASGRRYSVEGWGDAELIGAVPYLDVRAEDGV